MRVPASGWVRALEISLRLARGEDSPGARDPAASARRVVSLRVHMNAPIDAAVMADVNVAQPYPGRSAADVPLGAVGLAVVVALDPRGVGSGMPPPMPGLQVLELDVRSSPEDEVQPVRADLVVPGRVANVDRAQRGGGARGESERDHEQRNRHAAMPPGWDQTSHRRKTVPHVLAAPKRPALGSPFSASRPGPARPTGAPGSRRCWRSRSRSPRPGTRRNLPA